MTDREPLFCLIPGGPGLSPATLGTQWASPAVDCLVLETEGFTFEETVAGLRETLRQLGRPVVLCGHSFGGLYAAALATEGSLDVAGFVALAAPLSSATWSASMDAFAARMTPEMQTAMAVFYADPSDRNLQLWLASLAPIYFPESFVAEGSAVLANDLLSARAFAEIFAEFQAAPLFDALSERLKASTFPKWVVSGEQDVLMTPSRLSDDARFLGAHYATVPGAGHYPSLEKPLEFGALVEKIVAEAS